MAAQSGTDRERASTASEEDDDVLGSSTQTGRSVPTIGQPRTNFGIKEPARSAVAPPAQNFARRVTKERKLMPSVPSSEGCTGSSSKAGSPRSSSASTPRPNTNSRPQQGLHGPSNLPPVSYPTPSSPWKPKQPRKHSKDIEPGKLGALMDRMDRIELAVGKYVDQRGKSALRKSVVPGLDGEGEENINKGGSKCGNH